MKHNNNVMEYFRPGCHLALFFVLCIVCAAAGLCGQSAISHLFKLTCITETNMSVYRSDVNFPFTPDPTGYLYEPEYTDEEFSQMDLERAEREDREAVQAKVGPVVTARERVNENFVHDCDRNTVKYMSMSSFYFHCQHSHRYGPFIFKVFPSNTKLSFQLQSDQRETADRQHYL